MRGGRTACLSLLFLFPCAALAAAPAKPADDTPWGEAADGIACRVIVRSDYCIGELVRMTVELKNVSDKERLIPQIFDFRDPKRARLTISGPDGAVRQLSHSGYGIPGPGGPSFNIHTFVPIKAGEVKRIEFADIREPFGAGLSKPGKYSLTYAYSGAKPAGVGGAPAPTEQQLAAAWSVQAASKPAAFEIRPIGKDDLVVHEWGVFTVHNDFKYANADRKAEWESLPKFFYRQFPNLRLTWVPGAWNKPIIYFHSKRECLKIEAKVTFAEGAPVVWWPAAAEPLNQGMRANPEGVNTGAVFRSLKWSAWLGKAPETTSPVLEGGPPVRRAMVRAVALADGPGGGGPAGTGGTPELPADSWLVQARNVKEAVPVTVHGTKLGGNGAPWDSGQIETEKFIFYDGLCPVPAGLGCTASDPAGVTMKNTAKHALRHLFVADGRNGFRFAHLPELAAGATAKVEFGKLDAAGAEKAVLAALTETGLTETEAAALFVVWKPQFLAAPGLTAFYILPQAEYDRMLPLSVTPAPAQTVRVGVVLHPRLEGEPELLKQAAKLLVELDDADFNKREAAAKSLVTMGPSAIKAIREAAETSKSTEVVTRCRQILENFDASVYLDKAPKK